MSPFHADAQTLFLHNAAGQCAQGPRRTPCPRRMCSGGLWLALGLLCGACGSDPGAKQRSDGLHADRVEELKRIGHDPRVSRSRGETGGLIVMWPRVVPDSAKDSAEAATIHRALQDVARQVLPQGPIDVRPSPERVCPRQGCRATVLGAMLSYRAQDCVVLAWAAEPGKSPSRIVPWVGGVRLKQSEVPFREPPENAVVVHDYIACDKAMGKLPLASIGVSALLRDTLGANAASAAQFDDPEGDPVGAEAGPEQEGEVMPEEAF